MKAALIRYLSAWWPSFVDHAFTQFRIISIFATILGWLGLQVLQVVRPYETYIATTIILILFVSAAWSSRPRFRLNPKQVLGQQIEIEELDYLVADIARVGLLGRDGAGKSTFLAKLLMKREPQRKTSKPYAVVTSLPDGRYMAVIDSVGDRDASQNAVYQQCDIVCFFIDHARGDAIRTVEAARLDRHIELARQIALEAAHQDRIRPLVLVANKSDLWADSHPNREHMARAFDEIAQKFRDTGKFQPVDLKASYSNLRTDDLSALLGMITDVAKQ